jgi:hypothetical protein
MVDRHYSLNLKPWSARTLYVYAHADLAQKYSVGLQEIFVSRLCFQEENYFSCPVRISILLNAPDHPLHLVDKLGNTTDKRFFILWLTLSAVELLYGTHTKNRTWSKVGYFHYILNKSNNWCTARAKITSRHYMFVFLSLSVSRSLMRGIPPGRPPF